ncbi:TPM domain-containing protein [Campylobacter concisus]|uniref:TPM domain-containing protein n=1 Tax=Campylobacter concisus TaxID=199 RepID=A0A7S9RQV3_9BACT|nr:TPM domain-containing protein [Campylobacter concisus]QPH95982.1 TPM domain-containing protein [Campylobacter concisus]
MKKIISLLLFAFSFCFALNFNEQINDEAHIFSQSQRDELLNLVQNFEQNSTTQIAIVTLNSLENKSIEDLSLEIARGYKLGQKKDSNGVLLVVAPNEKKVRIEVGYGLEGMLTDAISSQIINSVMIPQFKNGKMSEGVKEGVLAIIKVASGEEFSSKTSLSDLPFGVFAFFAGMLSCFASVIFGKFFMRTGFSTCFAGLVSTALEQGFGVQNYLIIFGVFAFIFAVFFFILKDVFKRNSQGGSLPMGFRRDNSGSNGGGRSSSGRGGGFSGGGGGFGGGGASGSW